MLSLPGFDFDGVAEMWVESVEDYAKHMQQETIAESVRGMLYPDADLEVLEVKVSSLCNRRRKKVYGSWKSGPDWLRDAGSWRANPGIGHLE